MRRVVVTGMGAIGPCGLDALTTWDCVRSGRSGLGPITRFDATGWSCRAAGEVRDFDAQRVLGKKLADRAGRFIQFAVIASREAWSHAGLDASGLVPERVGVFVGTAIGGIPEICSSHMDLVEGGHRRVSPFFIPRSLTNIAAGQVAIALDAKGPNGCPATACAAGNHAIGQASLAIATGQADVAVAGGTEATIAPLTLAGFQKMRVLSTWEGDIQASSRPFSADRTGMVVSEGSGVVVLEALDHALARGAEIHAELAGFATTTDAHHVTSPAPGGEGAARCMAQALRNAGVSPEAVDYVNAHGTGTLSNDVNETRAIRSVFGRHAAQLMVSSTKGSTGHLLGASGGMEAVITAFALRDGTVPPTLNLDVPDPDCDLDYVAHTSREVPVRVALSNAFGFGGTNAVLVFRRWEGT